MAKIGPIQVGHFFLALACTSLFWGFKILLLGWQGWQDAKYPLSEHRLLTGRSARIAASAIIAFGLLTISCGIAALIFGIYRVWQLW